MCCGVLPLFYTLFTVFTPPHPATADPRARRPVAAFGFRSGSRTAVPRSRTSNLHFLVISSTVRCLSFLATHARVPRPAPLSTMYIHSHAYMPLSGTCTPPLAVFRFHTGPPASHNLCSSRSVSPSPSVSVRWLMYFFRPSTANASGAPVSAAAALVIHGCAAISSARMRFWGSTVRQAFTQSCHVSTSKVE